MFLNRFWVTEVSKLVMIWAKIQSAVWRKMMKKRISRKCNKKGIKCELKYVQKKLNMNLQLRSNNGKYSEAVKKTKSTA